MNVKINYGTLKVYGGDTEVCFSRRNGKLYSVKHKGTELLKGDMELNFWRAITDNDRGNKQAVRCGCWRQAGKLAGTGIGEIKNNGKSVTVEIGFSVYTVPECKGKLVFTVGSKGMHIDYYFKAEEGLPEIPEISLVFPISADYERLEYLGRGPHENYIDRNCGAYIGLYKAAVKDLFVPYQKPQEYGERTAVRKAAVKKGDGTAPITFIADTEIEINLSPYTADELENAPHIHELPDGDTLYFRAVACQMGVGGYDSWGSHTLNEYKNPSGKEYRYGFTMMF